MAIQKERFYIESDMHGLTKIYFNRLKYKVLTIRHLSINHVKVYTWQLYSDYILPAITVDPNIMVTVDIEYEPKDEVKVSESDTYVTTLRHFGAKKQLNKVVEELSELNTEISKCLFKWDDNKLLEDNLSERLLEEFVDAQIMMNQLAYMLLDKRFNGKYKHNIDKASGLTNTVMNKLKNMCGGAGKIEVKLNIDTSAFDKMYNELKRFPVVNLQHNHRFM